MSTVSFREVATLGDAMIMRAVRNEVRQFLTHDTSHIGVLRQLWWYYFSYLPASWRRAQAAYLVFDEKEPVGYGMIRCRGGRWWLTGALLEHARGRGLGDRLFRRLIIEAYLRGAPKGYWLDVLTTNAPAIRLYEKLGFRRVEENSARIVMKIVAVRLVA